MLIDNISSFIVLRSSLLGTHTAVFCTWTWYLILLVLGQPFDPSTSVGDDSAPACRDRIIPENNSGPPWACSSLAMSPVVDHRAGSRLPPTPDSKSAWTFQRISFPLSVAVTLMSNAAGGGVVSLTKPVLVYSAQALATASFGNQTAVAASPWYLAAG